MLRSKLAYLVLALSVILPVVGVVVACYCIFHFVAKYW